MSRDSLIHNISIRTGITSEVLETLIENSRYEFRKVIIDKEHKSRVLYILSPQLKLVQNYIIQLYLNKIKVSEFAHAYVKERSIKSNVYAHRSSKFFFQTDISSFFPSISKDIISKSIKSSIDNVSARDLDLILKAVAPFGHLDLGSSSSPIISNIIMYDFDVEINDKLRAIDSKMIYTRYSDDIAISSKNEISGIIEEVVNETLIRYGFKMNLKKTKSTELINYIKITGLYLHNDQRVTVGSKQKKRIKHYLHLVQNDKPCDVEYWSLLGLISFIKDIEPEFYQYLILRYSDNRINIIQKIKNNIYL